MSGYELKEDRLFDISVPFSSIADEARLMFENSIKRKLEDMVERLAKPVRLTHEVLLEKTTLIGQYRAVRLKKDTKAGDEELVLLSGDRLYGEALGEALKGADYVLFFIVTLKNYDETELSMQNAIERFYLDSWGSAYIWNAINYIKLSIKESLENKELDYSRFLFPGQNGLPLQNQKTVFSVLKPNALCVRLNESCLMKPLKSYTSFLTIKGDIS